MEHIEDKLITINSDVINLVLVALVLIKDYLNHQKDAHPKGIRVPGFLSYIRVYMLT